MSRNLGRPVRAYGFLALALLFVVPNVGRANPGDLDPSFGTGGTVTTFLGTNQGDVGARAVALQGDGKIVVAGSTYTGTQDAFALARYNPDGSLDATFGTGGMVTTTLGSNDAASAIVLQGDGKLVVAGSTYIDADSQDAFALARYNPNGSLDATFGTGGMVTTTLGSNDAASAIALQGDGKLVVAGSTYIDSDSQDAFALARYNSNGSLDPTFGTAGTVATVLGMNDAASAIALQGDGKIVVAGSTITDTSGGSFALARYNPNGSLDATFGTGGTVITAIGHADYATAVTLQGDGKIVAAGSANDYHLLALARYNPAGSLDATFGTAGIVTTTVHGTKDAASAITLQGDGKILAVGSTYTGTHEAFALARYDPDGSLDATFGTGGIVTTAFRKVSAGANAVALQRDGNIVAAGSTIGRRRAFVLARYLNDTTTDPCTTARCTLAAALTSPACVDQTIPASVTGKLATAENLIDQAATTPGKKARKLLRKAKNLLSQAGAKATRAAKGKKAKVSPTCAAVVKDAAGRVAAHL